MGPLLINFRDTRDLLIKCAATAMNSKLIASHSEFFSNMVVDAVLKLESDLNLDLIGVKKESGGALEVRKNQFSFFILRCE